LRRNLGRLAQIHHGDGAPDGVPRQESGRDSPFGSGPVSYFNLELESGAKAHFVGRFDAALKGRSSTLRSALKGESSTLRRGPERRSSTLDAVVEVSLGFAIPGQPKAAVPTCFV
jgi:hypothetical protein